MWVQKLSEENLNLDALKTLIGWGFRRQLTWAALFATFLLGLNTLYEKVIIHACTHVSLLLIYLMLFFGLTITLYRVIRYLLWSWTWEEQLQEHAPMMYDEIERTTRGLYKRFIQIHEGRASLNWLGLFVVVSFYGFLVCVYHIIPIILRLLWILFFI